MRCVRESLSYSHNIREQIEDSGGLMYVVAIGWMYVVVMASIAEAMSPQGTWLGALMTFIGWGLAPCALVLYILGTPARKRRLRVQAAHEARETQQVQQLKDAPATAQSTGHAGDAHTPDASATVPPSPAASQAVSRDG